MRRLPLLRLAPMALSLLALVLASCAAPPSEPVSSDAPRTSAPSGQGLRAAASFPSETGPVEIDVNNALGHSLPARIDFYADYEQEPYTIEAPRGNMSSRAPIGTYDIHIYVYDQGIPVLADVQNKEIDANSTTFIMLNLLEGSAENLSPLAFDSDGDLVLDRVELDWGTDPENAGDFPGALPVPYHNQVFSEEGEWYRGEMRAYSNHGIGQESVGQLIRRAERLGLDFLAITDRNTMASVFDPDYRSDSVVLIPALEWGNNERGVAVLYGPRSIPRPPTTRAAAQAEMLRLQAQGGIFTVGHPTNAANPWLWGLSYANAIEVWHGSWRQMTPLRLNQLEEDIRLRRSGRLVHSIAAAAAAADKTNVAARQAGMQDRSISGNRQATLFWDYELLRGLKAGAIGGSGTHSARSPMAQPVTYILAREKSYEGIMEGLRFGRTFISSGLDGPELRFRADVLNNGMMDVDISGIVPINVEVMFEMSVRNGQGMKLQLLRNGRPIYTGIIDSNIYVKPHLETPSDNAVYRIQVIGDPSNLQTGYGATEVYAISSPIYAHDIMQPLLWSLPDIDPDQTWVRIDQEYQDALPLPDPDLSY